MKKFVRQSLTAYIYISPALAFILFVYAYPVFKIFQDSLYQSMGSVHEFIGLRNYVFLFANDTYFWPTLGHNATMLISLPIMVAISIFIALLLFEQIRGWRLHRFAIFVPYVLSITVIGVVFGYILRRDGILNYWLQTVGLHSLVRDWLGDPRYALLAVISVIVWREIGFGSILFLARLLAVSKDLYEAAEVEGASWWQKHRYVSLPQLKWVTEFFIVMEAINLFSWVFNYIYVMTQGGPGKSTYVMELYIYQTSFRYGLMELGSALAVVLFLIVSGLVLLSFRLRKEDTIETPQL